MAKFNWSILDRASIIDFLLVLSPKIVKVNLTTTKFHTLITSHLKAHIPIRTRKSKHSKVDPGTVWIGGMYMSANDMEKQKCIEIIFEYCDHNNKICLTNFQFKKVCINIADTLLHEIIHMRQYRRRKFKSLPDYASNADKTELRKEQQYLGCSDEIDAYAFNIACELHSKFNGDYNQIIAYLNENQKRTGRRFNSWRMYLKAFQHDHSHPIIQRVKKKVVRYLPFAEIGKPYRNKDWIHR